MPSILSLAEAATKIREMAYAPYSNFKVGAAIRSQDGHVFTGTNVENVAYPEGTCAEAGAISAMIAAGQHKIIEVAVIGSADEPTSPCGGCRQKLAEFAGPDVQITMLSPSGKSAVMSMAELLPGAFTPDQLDT